MIALAGVGVILGLAAWARFPYRLIAVAAVASLMAAAIASFFNTQDVAVAIGNLALLCFIAAVVLAYRSA